MIRNERQYIVLRDAAAAPCANAAIRIVTLRLNTAPPRVEEMFAVLSPEERATAARFRFDRDRCRFILVRGNLRKLLGAELRIEPQSVDLDYGPYGKPRLSGRGNRPLHFNISHSRDVAIIALSHGRDIGVDVEALQEVPDADEVAAQFFSQRENREYRATHPSEKVAAFFNCWTRKEALVKALGQGLSYPLHDFDVSVTPGQPACLHRLGEKTGAACGWLLQSFSPAPGFVAAFAVAAGDDRPAVSFERIPWSM